MPIYFQTLQMGMEFKIFFLFPNAKLDFPHTYTCTFGLASGKVQGLVASDSHKPPLSFHVPTSLASPTGIAMSYLCHRNASHAGL